MGAPTQGVCSAWATTDDVLECSACTDADLDLLTSMIGIASDVLYMMTGQQWRGSCSATVRPYELSCSCSRPGSCKTIHETSLGAYPITAINSVKVREYYGGPLQTLTSSQYRMDNHRTLVRLNEPNGTNPGWPRSQDLHQNEGGDGVFFEVAYDYGSAPPAGGVHAAAVLACEMALACDQGSGKCRLPKRTQSVVRQGVTQEFVAPELFIQEGLVGIYEVDLWVRSVNPNRRRRSGAIYSPDLTTRYRVAGT